MELHPCSLIKRGLGGPSIELRLGAKMNFWHQLWYSCRALVGAL